jgi:hypothetical protein
MPSCLPRAATGRDAPTQAVGLADRFYGHPRTKAEHRPIGQGAIRISAELCNTYLRGRAYKIRDVRIWPNHRLVAAPQP